MLRKLFKPVVVASFSLLEAVNAAVCYQDKNHQTFRLDCFPYNTSAILAKLTQVCGVTELNTDACSFERPYYSSFGHGSITGYFCQVSYDVRTSGPDVCAYRVFDTEVKDGFGTISDWVIAGAGTVVTVGSMIGIGYFLFKSLRRASRGEMPWIEVADQEYEALLKRAESLPESDEKTQLLTDMLEFKNKCECPVSLGIMSHPVSLECGHSFERSQIRATMVVAQFEERTATCPTCRDEIHTPMESLVVNEMLQGKIERSLRDFADSLDAIENPKAVISLS